MRAENPINYFSEFNVLEVFRVMAVDAEQFPVAAVRRVVVVVMVFMVDCQFTKIFTAELPGAAAADPRKQLQCLFTIVAWFDGYDTPPLTIRFPFIIVCLHRTCQPHARANIRNRPVILCYGINIFNQGSIE